MYIWLLFNIVVGCTK